MRRSTKNKNKKNKNKKTTWKTVIHFIYTNQVFTFTPTATSKKTYLALRKKRNRNQSDGYDALLWCP
ncbi:hypothetical protein E2C01_059592 [Portunus trituberculatus]|uniref:Uncharacterized protein n=1 Tax=Portunus trituberculatus TaxID=210409 RepID=A0A5B7H8U8_PORTR|nr:hypothetical protein [Portunus trituberculatus]